jgi:hypothetical protein
VKNKTHVSPAAVCGIQISQPSESNSFPAILTLNANDVTDINIENGSML